MSSMKETHPDSNTQRALRALLKRRELEKERFTGVKSILVVLSGRSMAFDFDSMRLYISLAYPGSDISFASTSGKAMFGEKIGSVDLLLDLSGPGTMQSFLFPLGMKRKSKHQVGRAFGLLRARLYERLVSESDPAIPKDLMEREFFQQKKVFELAGVSFLPKSASARDASHTIAQELSELRARSH